MKLTNREKQITELMLDGLNNDEICEYLAISYETLKTHFKNMYKKYNIKRGKLTNDCRSLLILKLINLKIKYANFQVNIVKEKYKKALISFVEIYQNKSACINCPVNLMNVNCSKKKNICIQQIWGLIK